MVNSPHYATISNEAITISCALSMKERQAAQDCIQVYEKKEQLHGYLPVKMMGMASSLCALIAGITLLIIVMNSYFPAVRKGEYYLLLASLSAALLFYQGRRLLLEHILKKNEPQERANPDNTSVLTLTREHISDRGPNLEVRTFWHYIQQGYRKDGFIFIKTQNNQFIVIPERAFAHEQDIQICINFINDRITPNE